MLFPPLAIHSTIDMWTFIRTKSNFVPRTIFGQAKSNGKVTKPLHVIIHPRDIEGWILRVHLRENNNIITTIRGLEMACFESSLSIISPARIAGKSKRFAHQPPLTQCSPCLLIDMTPIGTNSEQWRKWVTDDPKQKHLLAAFDCHELVAYFDGCAAPRWVYLYQSLFVVQ